MRVLAAWRRFYGDNPMHLLALLGCFALVGYVLLLLYPDPSLPFIAIWFAGAVIAHDLVLYPLYALADRTVVAGRWVRRRVTKDRVPRVPAVNHVRIPVIFSALLLVIYWPSITREGEPVLLFAAGRVLVGYADTWLMITAVLFLGSALIYAVRLARSAPRAARDGDATARRDPEPDPAPVPDRDPTPG